jgi:hypothetical protein
MALERYNQPIKSRRGSMASLGSAVRQVVSSGALEQGLAARQAITLWPEIAGEKLANVCSADSLRDGILFVKTKSSSWANELTFYKPELLRKISERIGSGLVNDIHFASSSRVGLPVEKPSDVTQDGNAANLTDCLSGYKAIDTSSVADPKDKLKLLIGHTSEIDRLRREKGCIECIKCKTLFLPHQNDSLRAARICPLCRIIE